MRRYSTRRPVRASFYSQSAERASDELYRALRNLYDVMSKYEDSIESLLDDPSYFDATIDEIRYQESVRLQR